MCGLWNFSIPQYILYFYYFGLDISNLSNLHNLQQQSLTPQIIAQMIEIHIVCVSITYDYRGVSPGQKTVWLCTHLQINTHLLNPSLRMLDRKRWLLWGVLQHNHTQSRVVQVSLSKSQLCHKNPCKVTLQRPEGDNHFQNVLPLSLIIPKGFDQRCSKIFWGRTVIISERLHHSRIM